MAKTLYLMRHGQTLFNFKGLIQGFGDSPLTELGILQAEKARSYFESKGINFDLYASSTQERASDTLENVAPNQSYQRLKGLKEWHFGLFEGESVYLFDNLYKPEDLFGDRIVPFKGESKQDVEDRIVKALHELMSQTKDNALVVSHGTIIGVFLRYCLDKNEALKHNIGNCNILKFKYDDGTFSFEELIDPNL
ncbi:TPA: histidine phosphatase family protein [Staphylococcus argenteus]|uniref:Phosphoglycerate mutase family protein n=1 Tax=Staphylococcus argenteus TaxID=985002 RepID=A0A7U7PXS0_9STAP|nr:histidine phosphatase family protein [Staphylococcus argenteus]BBN30213.1 phosphoglycerate mutase family protein [Staphylococcus aureus]EKF1504897.1 histidine phosphatase family protein [Staphylococcus argenteus]EYG88392.1 phosphoglycerate mutase [Staphylococcus argenteus]EYL84450.1 phosphoglycerate mutase [Staphylococcus argenteus]MBE2082820.1 histidine phosphatase family protein [Staphylococcus argenteus]